MRAIVEKVGDFDEINIVRRIRVGRYVLVARYHISRICACQDTAQRIVSQLSRFAVLVGNCLRLPRGIKARITNNLPICISNRGNHALSAHQREIIPRLGPGQRTRFRRAAL